MSLIISFIVIKEQGREGEKVLRGAKQTVLGVSKKERVRVYHGQTNGGQGSDSEERRASADGGGRGLPCGSCQLGEGGSRSLHGLVSLLLGTSVIVWREAGKNSRATTWKISLPSSPDYGILFRAGHSSSA